MKKIAIIQSGPNWFGGAQYVAVKTITSLIGNFNVDVYSFCIPDIEEINSFYDVSLSEGEVSFKKIPFIGTFGSSDRGKFFKHYWAMSYMKNKVDEYDLMISTRNEMDLGGKGLQYIHSPSIAAHHVQSIKYQDHIGKPNILKKIYIELVKNMFTKIDKNNFRKNATIVNSKWTASRIKKAYNVDPLVIFPPVPNDFPKENWGDKEDIFVSLGRITPSKRLIKIIDILSRVRNEGFKVGYKIVGKKDDKKYFSRLIKNTKKKDWIEVYHNVSRKKLKKVVSKCSYGIHGMKSEHFGIAVAEMVNAGNIVFVPKGGGQVEIVNDDNLVYEGVKDAVTKIIKVLESKDMQKNILSNLSKRSKKLTPKVFEQKMLKVVKDELNM
jgi:glycosyltransferase involved in cell wall biosynthesis